MSSRKRKRHQIESYENDDTSSSFKRIKAHNHNKRIKIRIDASIITEVETSISFRTNINDTIKSIQKKIEEKCDVKFDGHFALSYEGKILSKNVKLKDIADLDDTISLKVVDIIPITLISGYGNRFKVAITRKDTITDLMNKLESKHCIAANNQIIGIGADEIQIIHPESESTLHSYLPCDWHIRFVPDQKKALRDPTIFESESLCIKFNSLCSSFRDFNLSSEEKDEEMDDEIDAKSTKFPIRIHDNRNPESPVKFGFIDFSQSIQQQMHEIDPTINKYNCELRVYDKGKKPIFWRLAFDKPMMQPCVAIEPEDIIYIYPNKPLVLELVFANPFISTRMRSTTESSTFQCCVQGLICFGNIAKIYKCNDNIDDLGTTWVQRERNIIKATIRKGMKPYDMLTCFWAMNIKDKTSFHVLEIRRVAIQIQHSNTIVTAMIRNIDNGEILYKQVAKVCKLRRHQVVLIENKSGRTIRRTDYIEDTSLLEYPFATLVVVQKVDRKIVT